MEMRFDDETAILYLSFARGHRVTTEQDRAELLYLETGQVFACRIWLENTVREFGISNPEGALKHVIESGWTFGRTVSWERDVWSSTQPTGGVPWVFYQFLPASGKLGWLDEGVIVHVDTDQKTVTGFELFLSKAPVKLHV